MKHQALRDAIRNLMKANDKQLDDLTPDDNYELAQEDTLEEQNEKLQAILDADKGASL